jgi:5-bromo-4-chloroindolyl phosphate hydrolysis protein
LTHVQDIFEPIFFWLIIMTIIIVKILCRFLSSKIEKEKKKLAQEAGLIRAEVTGSEVGIISI